MPHLNLDYEVPEKLLPIYEPRRYKTLYGGRGGTKSWGVARALLDLGIRKPLRILCAREFQSSIADSVHKLLSDQIVELGLTEFYSITRSKITGVNGTEFGFEGLKHNITTLKSYEGADIAWIEEAQTVSKTSWDILIPTIRKDGSEIWLTFNPALEEDETYQRFVINPPPDSLIIKVGWEDNPWFPEVLRAEKDYLKEKDPDSYLNIWEGHCRITLDGAIYAKELREATEGGRITNVPYDTTVPVSVFVDLGRADLTSIWFAQTVAMEFRIIDFYENRGHFWNHYLKYMQNLPYLIDTVYLPHDAKAKTIAARRNVEELTRVGGFRPVVLENISKQIGINAARTIFPNCYFDQKKCADGLQSLRHYRYEVDEDTGQYSKDPMHDDFSHGADAFRYLAMALTERKAKPTRNRRVAAGGWMG